MYALVTFVAWARGEILRWYWREARRRAGIRLLCPMRRARAEARHYEKWPK